MNRLLHISVFLSILCSCAVVHHVQLGEIKHKKNHVLVPINLKISEFGLDFQNLASSARAISGRHSETAKWLELVALFQMGPRTGNSTWSGPDYADKLSYELYQKCPSGDITGLNLVRKSTKISGVSGEYVEINGFCHQPKTEPKKG